MTTDEDSVTYHCFVMHHRHIATNSWLSVGEFLDFIVLNYSSGLELTEQHLDQFKLNSGITGKILSPEVT